jgi:anaphase-promoting complex subunit 4
MIPALERATVILSRLYGISKYQGSNGNTGFSSQQIKTIMETITCMNLVCARILNYVVEELDLFSSFSAWLRYEIDRLASDSSNSPSDEQIEKEAVINHSKVLEYIQTCLTNSRISAFFPTKEEEELKEELRKQFEEAERGISIFELLDKQLQNHELGQPYLAALPKVELIYQSLERQANAIFKLIAEGCWKRNVIFGQPVPIHQSKDWGLTDMTQCVSVYLPPFVFGSPPVIIS